MMPVFFFRKSWSERGGCLSKAIKETWLDAIVAYEQRTGESMERKAGDTLTDLCGSIFRGLPGEALIAA